MPEIVDKNRRTIGLFALATIVLALLPFLVSGYTISFLYLMYANVALATAWSFFSGATRYISLATNGRLPIIGVGGIEDVAGASEKLDAGATLVQIYTGMIFEGPFLAARLARGLANRQSR